MPGATRNRVEVQPHTGARILALLATPLNVMLLRELQAGPKLPDELWRASGQPARRTLRSHLKQLERLGIVTRRGMSIYAGSREYDLAKPGRELRFVMVALERWLNGTRWERLDLDSDAGGDAIKAVLAGWSSQIMRGVAARPCSLAELNELAGLSSASLERRVETMRQAGLLEIDSSGKAPAYVRTAWLCSAMGPIVAASRWERHNLPEASARIRREDAETALLLTLPLMQLPPNVSGSCRLVVEIPGEELEDAATVTAVAKDCRVASYEPVGRDSAASASGPPSAWFRAAIEAQPGHLEVTGDPKLARGLLDALYLALYGIRAPSRFHTLSV